MCCTLSRFHPKGQDCCRSDGLCFHPAGPLWRESCTDPSWRSPSYTKSSLMVGPSGLPKADSKRAWRLTCLFRLIRIGYGMFWQEHLLRFRQHNMLRKRRRILDQIRRCHNGEPIWCYHIIFKNHNHHLKLYSSYLQLIAPDFPDVYRKSSSACVEFFSST